MANYPSPKTLESLTDQNVSVSRAIDKIVANISEQPNAEFRTDWNEICKTSELIIREELSPDEVTISKTLKGRNENRNGSGIKTQGSESDS